jgi:hypothetical protein
VFICEVEDKPPMAKPDEAQDIRWMTRAGLRRLIATNPERIFTFQLGALIDESVQNRINKVKAIAFQKRAFKGM